MTTTLDTTNRTTQRHPRRHRLIGIAAAIGIAVVVLGVTPTSASAITYSASGSSGYVVNDNIGGYDRNIFDTGRTIYESPQYANQQQQVCITTQLWQVVFAGYGTGQSAFWKNVQSHRRCGWISAAGTSIRDNGVIFSVGGGGFYSVSADVRWYSSNGTQIGSKFIDYNQVGDYYCYQSAWRCNISTVNWGARDAYVTFA